jgi:hypothetical protein
VAGIERQCEEHDDDEDDDDELPPHEDVVEAGEQRDAVEVDDAEDEHERDAHRDAGAGEDGDVVDGVHEPGQIARSVLDGRHDLDRHGRRDESQVIQPLVKLAKDPNEKCGKRMTPPATGNITPSSA